MEKHTTIDVFYNDRHLQKNVEQIKVICNLIAQISHLISKENSGASFFLFPTFNFYISKKIL